MRVLIPSDHRNWAEQWVTAYKNAGCEVVTGTFNFDHRSMQFDLIHYIFLEELCGWKPPSTTRLLEIEEGLQWWRDQCPSIATVNNVYPNGYEGNQAFEQLNQLFYRYCSRILHFSTASKELICKNLPLDVHN